MPDNKELKESIQSALTAFEKKPFADASLELLGTLGYQSERRLELKPNNAKQFQAQFDAGGKMNPKAALVTEWHSVDLLFQLTDVEIQQASSGMVNMFASKKVDDTDIRSYLFFAVELKGKQYTRTQLAGITREINKLFPMPVMVIFKYDRAVSLAIIARRINKKDGSKDVLEKVTLIKDIRFTGNRAQIEILHELAITQLMQDHPISNFKELQDAWEMTLDLNELNKKFYKEIANWYFWAVKTVKFPKDAEKDEATRNATSVIRLITRLIFVWFIKEKGLVPEDLFDPRRLNEILNFTDPKKSTFYKAILQNLFFATLNTEMGEGRIFRRENAKGQDPDYLMSNFYRYKRYFKKPDAALELFAGIPFLNGGLFECLDKEIEKGNVIRVDGFSDRDDNPLTVPDDLFLMEKDREIDLNEVFDTKNKKYKVRGLIHIFNNYKFTIEENTPIEEEIALDPELLGKVFENLLAAYNPETGTTARKQTGSFYTPREIVNYMVDEALLAYLESSLQDDRSKQSLANNEGISSQKPLAMTERLRDLLSYNPTVPDFTEDEKSRLIAAIDNVKVLDPAAGSGAFPMGVLHKLVFLLGKLDPNNEGWKKRQLDKANEKSSSEAREASIKSTEDIFENNHDDYGRKLYLIENCIYGVDIQPIAVQIAKLRFFISLVVDQKTNAQKPNLGIRPLPNLETKFVAANTLIGIKRPDTKPAEVTPVFLSPEVEEACELLIRKLEQYLISHNPDLRARYIAEGQQIADVINVGMGADFQPLAVDWLFTTAKSTATLKYMLPVKHEAKASTLVLRNQQIEEKEKELECVRREHFSARTPVTKRKYRDLDKKLRLEIADLLSTNHALEDETAQQLAGWDPYDQNKHADFFDPEWMFGIESGFDIVIGNPPYALLEKSKFLDVYGQRFPLLSGKPDLYRLFIERSVALPNSQGVICFIVPNTLLAIPSAQKLREYITDLKTIHLLVDLTSPAFGEVAVNNIILMIGMEKPRGKEVRIGVASGEDALASMQTLQQVRQLDWKKNHKCEWTIHISGSAADVIEKLETKSILFNKIFDDVTLGMQVYHNTIHTKKQMETRYLHSKSKINRNYIPEFSGRYIENFLVHTEKEVNYVDYSQTSAIYQKPDMRFFQGPRLILREIVGDRLILAYAEEQFAVNKSCYILRSESFTKTDLKALLAILSSRCILFWVQLKGDKAKQALFPRITMNTLRDIPIVSNWQKSKEKLSTIVDNILAVKRADPQADTSTLEGEIDQLVYQLYGLTEDEIAIIEGKA